MPHRSTESSAIAQGQFETHPGHIDPGRLDSWLAIGADGAITAYTGKCDFGQGVFTAQTQLIAEELCVPIKRVKLIECDTAITPDQGTTSGSQTTPTNFNTENLALAAATAREALLSLAAETAGRTSGSTQASRTASSSAGQGAESRMKILSGASSSTSRSTQTQSGDLRAEWTVLGKPVPSLDRVALMTGQFEFLHHLRVPGMLHGRVVRPPEMGATVGSVDEHSVRDLPGLIKVVVRKNFVGVVAETQYQAVLAARQLVVRWNPGPALPAQKTFFEHLQQQPSHDALSVDSQDVDTQLAAARSVLRARYTYPYQMHGSVGASCARG